MANVRRFRKKQIDISFNWKSCNFFSLNVVVFIDWDSFQLSVIDKFIDKIIVYHISDLNKRTTSLPPKEKEINYFSWLHYEIWNHLKMHDFRRHDNKITRYPLNYRHVWRVSVQKTLFAKNRNKRPFETQTQIVGSTMEIYIEIMDDGNAVLFYDFADCIFACSHMIDLMESG